MIKKKIMGGHTTAGNRKNDTLTQIQPNAAGIDIGSEEHFVAVPAGSCEESVRKFSSFTSDLHCIADWLKACGVTTVAMESTGVYWIPLFEILEKAGFEVYLVDPRQIKNVSGRKTDISDCQWIQQLHSYGLLKKAFRPAAQITELRTYVRARSTLIEDIATQIQRMQKSLSLMNVLLHKVVSDITGKTGMLILRAITSGNTDPAYLANFRDTRCKNSIAIIEEALTGHYTEEHLFGLKQALAHYDFLNAQVQECEKSIERVLARFESKTDKASPSADKSLKKKRRAYCFDLQSELIRITSVDLTQVPGIDSSSALKILSEIGTDMSKWKSEKHFCSWLGLSPNNKVSGGKRLSSRTKRTSNSAALTLRICANSLYNSKTALGAFLRRKKAVLGSPKAITACAHKMARQIYRLLKFGESYVEYGAEAYEERYRERVIKNLKKRARELSLKVVSAEEESEKNSSNFLEETGS